MKGQKTITGIYTYVDDAIKAVAVAKDSGLDYEAYSPTYVPELTEAVNKKRSPIGLVTIIGAMFGITAGFTLAIWTSMDWPLRVSAKNIVSVPGFVVVGYEWTILWGVLFTLFGVFCLCKIPNPFRRVGYDPRFSDDKFGVVIGCEESDLDELKKKLSDAGADEVLTGEGL